MKVFVIVLSWNSKDYISKCLDSLQKLVGKPEIVVVDNASTDSSAAFIKKNYPKLKLNRNDKNLGYAEGNNVGITYALDHGADFVWIVNPDVTVAPDSLFALLKAAEKYPRAGIFTSKIYFAPGFEFHQERYSKKEQGKVIWSAGGLIDWANLITTHRGVDEVDIGQYNTDSLTDFATGATIFIQILFLLRGKRLLPTSQKGRLVNYVYCGRVCLALQCAGYRHRIFSPGLLHYQKPSAFWSAPRFPAHPTGITQRIG